MKNFGQMGEAFGYVSQEVGGSQACYVGQGVGEAVRHTRQVRHVDKTKRQSYM